MDELKQRLQAITPGLFGFLRSARDTLARLAEQPGMNLHPWRWSSIRRLRDYQDRYQGKRCFVIGNGPSLKEMDLSHLADEYCFGMNRVYLAFEDWGFETDFLVSVNDLVIEQCRDDFHQLQIPKFFSWRARNLLYPSGSPDDLSHFIYTTYTGERFNRKLTSRFWEGATVTYICLQLAFCMGFKEVILIGVDHNFETSGPANQTVVSSGEDPNHFHPDYFGPGFRWQLPDLALSERSYHLAKQAYLKSGRTIRDATVGGKLEIFPKVDYKELF